MTLRTALGRARGLGSAKEGLSHWRLQRLTALALVPLVLWFVANLVRVADAPYAEAVEWVASPLNTTLLVLFVGTLYWHAQLGLQVVFEDYVHVPWLQVTLQVLVRFVAVALALTGIVSVLQVSLGA